MHPAGILSRAAPSGDAGIGGMRAQPTAEPADAVGVAGKEGHERPPTLDVPCGSIKTRQKHQSGPLFYASC